MIRRPVISDGVNRTRTGRAPPAHGSTPGCCPTCGRRLLDMLAGRLLDMLAGRLLDMVQCTTDHHAPALAGRLVDLIHLEPDPGTVGDSPDGGLRGRPEHDAAVEQAKVHRDGHGPPIVVEHESAHATRLEQPSAFALVDRLEQRVRRRPPDSRGAPDGSAGQRDHRRLQRSRQPQHRADRRFRRGCAFKVQQVVRAQPGPVGHRVVGQLEIATSLRDPPTEIPFEMSGRGGLGLGGRFLPLVHRQLARVVHHPIAPRRRGCAPGPKVTDHPSPLALSTGPDWRVAHHGRSH